MKNVGFIIVFVIAFLIVDVIMYNGAVTEMIIT